MKKVKILANYLPQFYETPENNEFWGKGYTDWEAVKSAIPVIRNQNQPKVPLNKFYYRLDEVSAIKWQVELAKKYGVYGFAMYHYWFSYNDYVLEKPSELILSDKSIDIHFMFLWDNSSWKRTWSNVKNANDWAPKFEKKNVTNNYNNGVLKELKYGNEEEWKAHFMYLLQFFKDERYIKIDGKPLFGFFQPQNSTNELKKMILYWQDLAISEGLPGLHIMVRDDRRNLGFQYKFKYSPFATSNKMNYCIYRMRQIVLGKLDKPLVVSYDKIWRELIKEAKKSEKNTFLSGFVKYDDTPRRGKHARIIVNASPAKFEKYLKKLIEISRAQNKEYLFLTAWNEWGEGAYLEPDEEMGNEYLTTLKKIVEETN